MELPSLDKKYIQEYKLNGVVVIPSVISKGDIDTTLLQLHEYLHSHCNYDVNDIKNTASQLSKLSSTSGSGGILDIFYQDWKLKLNEDPKVTHYLQLLWSETYAKNYENHDVNNNHMNDESQNGLLEDEESDYVFEHPYGKFDPFKGYMYIDRICYRLPSNIATTICGESKQLRRKHHLQRSLTPHLDCCPHNMHREGSKWRPIQDSMLPEQGGFEACLGLHREFKQWSLQRSTANTTSSNVNNATTSINVNSNTTSSNVNNNTTSSNVNGHITTTSSSNLPLSPPPPCVGDFTPIRPIEDKEILDRFRHIPCKAGDLVCWDYRIPHANSRYNTCDYPRIVIYIGLLPAVPVNEDYCRKQLDNYLKGILPIDQWHEMRSNNNILSQPQLCNYQFSDLGKKLMGLQSWNDNR